MPRSSFDKLALVISMVIFVTIGLWQLSARAVVVDGVGDGSWVVEREMDADVTWDQDNKSLWLGVSIGGDDDLGLSDVRFDVRNQTDDFVRGMLDLSFTIETWDSDDHGRRWLIYHTLSPNTGDLWTSQRRQPQQILIRLILPPQSDSIGMVDLQDKSLQWWSRARGVEPYALTDPFSEHYVHSELQVAAHLGYVVNGRRSDRFVVEIQLGD